MLDAQSRYAPDTPSLLPAEAFTAGKRHRALVQGVPEDRAPLRSEDGRYVVVADCRLDDREALQHHLGLGGSGSAWSDARLILEAYRRRGTAMVERLLGDFALAIWDRDDQTLLLARDLLGEKPLHFTQSETFIAFASMPAGLAAVPGLEVEVDGGRLAEHVADLWPQDRRSFFRNVERVRPGEWILIGPRGLRSAFHWTPPAECLRLAGLDEYAEAMRSEIDAAVARRLGRTQGAVGAHLSSGFDSSTVASAAALGLGAEPLYAFTSAPREGFAGPVPREWTADESGVAAATASLHPNVCHIVVRAPLRSPLEDLDRAHRLAWQPTGAVMNGMWWGAIDEEAAARGVSVMLTGEAGNFTVSAGLGTDLLPDMLRHGRLRNWWREARALRRSLGWRTILNSSFGPWVPPRLHRLIRGAWGLEVETPTRSWFVAEARRAAVAAQEPRSAFRMTPWPDSVARRVHFLRGYDFGAFRKRSLAQWGVEERDVTGDRRLVDFCFSLPPEALLHQGERRPALRRALAGRVAPEVLAARTRGYQSADWFERLDPSDLNAWIDAVDTRAAAEAVDMAAVRRVAATWPGDDVISMNAISLYPMSLLRALSCAQFATAMKEELDALRA